jgi:hypothetical protein
MNKAISNTSPLLYLYRVGNIDWLPKLFDEIWIPEPVKDELQTGKIKGYDVPNPSDYAWLSVINPKFTPSEWLVLDLGVGEIAAMALALENPERVILLDDLLARRLAHAAGLQVWGTLKVLLEAKAHGFIDSVEPYISRLSNSGMWISAEIKKRILRLAGEF